jgi:dihydrofolate reductase
MITMIACVDRKMGIGKDNKLLAHLPKDMAHFKKTTEGHVVVYGRKTWDSLPIKPLPNRKNIVLSRCSFTHKDVEWMSSISEVQDLREDIYVIGGSQIYKAFISYADELIISHIDAEFDADTFFPAIDMDQWMPYEIEKVKDRIDFNIIKYKRI